MYVIALLRNIVRAGLISVLIFGLMGCNKFADSLNSTVTLGSSGLAYLRGVNVMDLGISGGVYPGVYGTNYTKPSLSTIQALKARGHTVIRIPFLWERLQPTLGGALDTAYLGYIISVLQDANTAGVKIILDMHNYGKYNISGTDYVFGTASGPTVAQYVDVWTKLSTAIQANAQAKAALYAYDIMNEPAGLFDTRGQVDASTALSLGDFTSTVDGWSESHTGAGSSAVAVQDASHNGSIKVTYSTPAASYGFYGIQKNFISGLSSSNGKSIRVKGHYPATNQGTYPRLRFSTIATYTITQYTPAVLATGDFDFSITLTDAQWVGLTGFIFEIVINNPDGNGPYVVYIDQVLQGNAIVGVSPAQLWEQYSQAVVTALRGNGDTTTVMVEGYSFANAFQWASNHPTKWITDSANKIIYQAHMYLDNDFSGSYVASFSTETVYATGDGYASVADRAVARLKVFGDWCAAQGVKGYIGEIGWPNAYSSPTEYASWNAAGEAAYAYLDSIQMGATYWSTGSWLDNTYLLNPYWIDPTFTPLSSATVIENHPSK